jgi:hypothetical protein
MQFAGQRRWRGSERFPWEGLAMCFCRAKSLLASGVLVGLLAAIAVGEDRARAITKLLEEGWSITPQARRAADAHLQGLLQATSADALALQAGWLVLMQQRRFEEAQKLIDQHLKHAPDDLAALRAKTWTQAVLKNYPAAMLTAERLSARLASRVPADEAERALYEASVAFLGRLLGYFAGPVDDAIHQLERRRLEKRLVDRLDETHRAIFEEARDGVLGKFVELGDESAESTEGALAAATAEKEKTIADIQADRERLQDREKELDERRKKLQNELQAELASIDRQEQPLVQQQSQLATQLEALNADLLSYSSQILTLEGLASQANDATSRQQFLNQANTLAIVASRIEANMVSINRQLQALQGQRVAMQARRRQAQASANSQLERMNRELTELDRRERRNAGLERRAGRPITASTSKSLALSAQATALSTYDTFPLEAEKARLLETLR